MSDRLTAALDALAAAQAQLVDALREEIAGRAAADAPETLYDVRTAATLLGVGRTTVYAELGAKRLRSVYVGRRRLIPASALAKYAERAE